MTDQATPPPAVVRSWQLVNAQLGAADGGLSTAKVVHAAIALADAEGLAALTIRRLGLQLGSSSMALYRHVDSRDGLIVLMFDAALGSPSERIRDTEQWQESVRIWATEISERYRSHPWLLDAPLGGFPSTPNRALWLEYILQSLRPTGLGLQDMLDASLLVDGHARNTAYLDRELAKTRDQPPTTDWLKGLLVPSTFPMLSRVLTDGAIEDGGRGDDGTGATGTITFGLARIISGIDDLVHSRRD